MQAALLILWTEILNSICSNLQEGQGKILLKREGEMPAMGECCILCQLDQKQTPPLKHLIIMKIYFNYLGKGFCETKTDRQVSFFRST